MINLFVLNGINHNLSVFVVSIVKTMNGDVDLSLFFIFRRMIKNHLPIKDF